MLYFNYDIENDINERYAIVYISKMRLKNFRCFEDDNTLTFSSGVNYFVGNNNSGKTTIFEAIEFFKSRRQRKVR